VTRRQEPDPFAYNPTQPITKPILKRQYTSEILDDIHPLSPELMKAARATVCGNSIDAKDARKLLDMLGIEL
jgi:hypothetical protein